MKKKSSVLVNKPKEKYRQYKTTIPKEVAENWFQGGLEKSDKLIWKLEKGKIVLEKA